MITYLYWFAVVCLIVAVLMSVGSHFKKWKPAFVLAAIIGVVATFSYYFWLQQMFVKRFGGTMSITIPEEHYHISATWKDDNLWIEDYNPATNECIFREYSRGNLLQGKVVLKNCRPILGAPPMLPATE